jgi:hypothetical protein
MIASSYIPHTDFQVLFVEAMHKLPEIFDEEARGKPFEHCRAKMFARYARLRQRTPTNHQESTRRD